jgi:hypothetical protein
MKLKSAVFDDSGVEVGELEFDMPSQEPSMFWAANRDFSDQKLIMALIEAKGQSNEEVEKARLSVLASELESVDAH